MAQSITDIENEILTEKAIYSALDPLDSDSNTAIWRLWVFIMAQVTLFFEEVMDLFKFDIQAIIDNNQYGTDAWWFNKLLAFQYGDLLQYINNVFKYAVIDPTKQIIGFCSVTSLNGIVQIKVAANVGGQPAVLSEDQINGVISYCAQIQPSGIRFAVLSIPADLLKIIGTIYYDATGDIAVIKPAVEAAINAYLLALSSTAQITNGPISKNFDGALYVDKLINAIQAVPGVVGPQFALTTISAKNSGGAYSDFNISYQPESGYFLIDPEFALSDTLIYQPFVA